MKTFMSLLILLLLSACGGPDFKKVERLGKFRILGVFASAPEVAPNGASNLQLVVSDVDGGGRTILGTTQACIDPGIGLGAEVKCDHDPATINGAYTIDTTTLDMNNNLFTGVNAELEPVTVPSTIFVGRSTREQLNGVGYIVIFNFTVDGENHTVFKRIVATNRVAPQINTNPTGSIVSLNGAPIGTRPEEDDELTITTSTPQTYDYQNVDGSIENRTEEFEVAWFVTDGRLDKPKSEIDDTVKYLGKTATSASLVVALVRDERGGLNIVRSFIP